MKRSKFFLGLVAGLLALAGLAAGKAHRNGVRANIYTRVGIACVPYGIVDQATLVAPRIGPIKLRTMTYNKTLFTATLGNDVCVHPLYFGMQ